MGSKNIKWLYLVILSLVWGSSFILIKKALIALTPLQVGSLRLIFAAIFLVLVGLKSLKQLNRKQWKLIIISAFIGSFFPVFLFAYAETEIDSAIASILNATTPLLTLIFGVFFFKAILTQNKTIGVIVGLLGTVGLILSGASINPDQDYLYSFLVIIAATFYAVNVNILKFYMQDISAVAITVGSFLVLSLPATIILYYTGFFETESLTSELQWSLISVGILGVLGTGLAMILFNKLVQISDPVFTTSVTYIIPIVALGWGILDGEVFGLWQLFSAAIILIGVFIVNRSKNLMHKKSR
ncbi:DMT family transporter [Gramella sp. AN32]|nr:DMT family transporter [Gramella sp. AN32]MCM4155251.1 permease [Gramella sp. AN32]